jgi:hypothetical protein
MALPITVFVLQAALTLLPVAQDNSEVQLSIPDKVAQVALWSTVDVSKFTISLPPGWAYKPKQGMDSFVGAFVGDNIELGFDYGQWTGDPSKQTNPTYIITSETVGGRSAKIIIPKISGQGEIGIYFGGLDSQGNALKLGGHDIPAILQERVLQIVRSVRFK